jgi:hypothetical protein
MTLSAGTRLGPYEILAAIGAGGMGEVYKARDTRLERTVAVKVLPPHLSSSAELRERFEREAKTISRISHPHICALYDVNREGETEYLVMEFLEGETLSARLAKGALPLEQAPGLDRVVKMCLAKDPDDRWQSAHDVATQLKWIAEGGSQTGMPVAARPALRPRIAWMLAASTG